MQKRVAICFLFYTKDPSSWNEALLLATDSGAEGLFEARDDCWPALPPSHTRLSPTCKDGPSLLATSTSC